MLMPRDIAAYSSLHAIATLLMMFDAIDAPPIAAAAADMPMMPPMIMPPAPPIRLFRATLLMLHAFLLPRHAYLLQSAITTCRYCCQRMP